MRQCETCGEEAISRYCSACYRPFSPTDGFARRFLVRMGYSRDLVSEVSNKNLYKYYLDAVGKERSKERNKGEADLDYAGRLGLKQPRATIQRKKEEDR